MTLEKIISGLHFIGEVEKEVLRKIRRDEKQIDEISRNAYQGEDFDFPLCRRMPLTRLAVVVYLLIRKYDEYKAKGIPERIIFDTFEDVSLRAALYYKKTGRAGISREDVIWFRHIMNTAIFKIGSLQFQPFEMIYLDEDTIGEPFMVFSEEQKASLPAGTPVLNCHIQRGADLRPDSVTLSLQAAKSFFSGHFPEKRFRAFLCYSWMLFPPMVRRLPGNSNIRRFADRFRIIGACRDPEQATEFIFDHNRPRELSADAGSLRKLAFEHPEKLGFACGIIAVDDVQEA